MRPIRVLTILGSLLIAAMCLSTVRADDTPFDDALVKLIAEGVKAEVGAGAKEKAIKLVAEATFKDLEPQLSEAAKKRKDDIVKAAIALVNTDSAVAAPDERGLLSLSDINDFLAVLKVINGKFKAGKDGNPKIDDSTKRIQAILAWLKGGEVKGHPLFKAAFSKVFAGRDASPAQIAQLEKQVERVVNEDKPPTPPEPAPFDGDEVLNTPDRKEKARALIARTDAALRVVIPNGADERDDPITPEQRKAKLLRWIKGEFKNDTFFLRFLSKLADGKTITKISDPDLATLTAMIDDIVGKTNPTPSPLEPSRPGTGTGSDGAGIFDALGISEIADLFGEVETLIESPGCLGHFHGCRKTRLARVVPARSRYVIVRP